MSNLHPAHPARVSVPGFVSGKWAQNSVAAGAARGEPELAGGDTYCFYISAKTAFTAAMVKPGGRHPVTPLLTGAGRIAYRL